MSKMDQVRSEMVAAMKAKDKPRKDALSMLLQALKAKFIDKRADLTEEEENTIVLKEIKQAEETLMSAPADRTDIIDECNLKISVYKEFAPSMMDEAEIRKTIEKVLTDLNIENPTVKEKGLITKNLMPLVKGKADGSLVSKTVAEYLK